VTDGRLVVAFALVFRERRLLVTQRAAEAHLGGLWEFPGGKLRAGESVEACAVREVLEETRVVVTARARRPVIEWDYPERRVALHPVECEWVSGDGELVEVANLTWATSAELGALSFPAANAELIRELRASGLLD
jgi:mutator protein MutT